MPDILPPSPAPSNDGSRSAPADPAAVIRFRGRATEIDVVPVHGIRNWRQNSEATSQTKSGRACNLTEAVCSMRDRDLRFAKSKEANSLAVAG